MNQRDTYLLSSYGDVLMSTSTTTLLPSSPTGINANSASNPSFRGVTSATSTTMRAQTHSVQGDSSNICGAGAGAGAGPTQEDQCFPEFCSIASLNHGDGSHPAVTTPKYILPSNLGIAREGLLGGAQELQQQGDEQQALHRPYDLHYSPSVDLNRTILLAKTGSASSQLNLEKDVRSEDDEEEVISCIRQDVVTNDNGEEPSAVLDQYGEIVGLPSFDYSYMDSPPKTFAMSTAATF